MIRILICDDHAIVRQGLRQIVENSDDITVADEADCGEKVLQMIIDDKYDVVVLDISMAGIGGIETLKEIVVREPKLAVLILSMHPEEQYAIRVMRAGAAGYLNKRSAPDELREAIRTVAAGKKYITAAVSEQLISNLNADKKDSPHEKLSDREYQVFTMLAEGKTVSDIAKNMCVSVKTVSTYKSRVLEKMCMDGVPDIVRYAVVHKLT